MLTATSSPQNTGVSRPTRVWRRCGQARASATAKAAGIIAVVRYIRWSTIRSRIGTIDDSTMWVT